MKENTEITDIVDMVRNGPVDQTLLEQEAYFDAGVQPTPHVWNNVRTEWIDGVKYTCYS
jgi:hypothetical protein|tara:strand:- start:58 stop:234 length:177 start_codon:yes stop_codon:yes gene_type:complete